MSDGPEARPTPGLKERIDAGPAMKHDGNPVLFEDTIHLPHRRLEPVGVRIILDGASGAVAVVHQIGRIGEDKVHASLGHRTHRFYAVAVKDLIGKAALL